MSTSAWARSGRYWGTSGRDGESNKTPIILSIKESVMVEGVEFFPFVAYSTGKIYSSVVVSADSGGETPFDIESGRQVGYDIITASFTGFSKDQMKLFIRGTYQRKKGSVGMFVEKSDLNLVVNLIKQYNRTFGFDTTVIEPNILDKELFEI